MDGMHRDRGELADRKLGISPTFLLGNQVY